MKRPLAVSTVRRGLASLGFVDCYDDHNAASEICMVYVGLNASRVIVVRWSTGNIVFDNARWVEAPNVHVVSHFGFPRSRVDLRSMLDEVRRIYGTLCGCSFPQEIPIPFG